VHAACRAAVGRGDAEPSDWVPDGRGSNYRTAPRPARKLAHARVAMDLDGTADPGHASAPIAGSALGSAAG
jgi:hypothetical protein